MTIATWPKWFNSLLHHVRRARDSADFGHADATTPGGTEETPWVEVYTATHRLEAEVIRGRLAAEDIPVVLSGEAIATVYGLTQGPLAQVHILVPEPFVDQALQILQSDEPMQDAST